MTVVLMYLWNDYCSCLLLPKASFYVFDTNFPQENVQFGFLFLIIGKGFVYLYKATGLTEMTDKFPWT